MKRSVLLFCAAAMLLLCACGVYRTSESLSATSVTPPASHNSEFRVLLYGENHTHPVCLEKELEAWEELYAGGARHLFVECSHANAALLNMWMRNEIELFDEIDKMTEMEPGTVDVNSLTQVYFFQSVKAKCPETVFHGTDIENEFDTVGAEYLEYLESSGRIDSEEYERTKANCEQGKRAHQDGSSDDGYLYREICLVENFIDELERLDPQTVMGIYGRVHVDLDKPQTMLQGNPNMATQLHERYGDCIQASCLTMAEEAPDSSRFPPIGPITLHGKTYKSVFAWAHDYSVWAMPYRQVVYWRLEDSYSDFENCPTAGQLEPLLVVCDKNHFLINGVYLAECTTWNGGIERFFFRAGSSTVFRFGLNCIDVAED